ncbi:MAG TPA: dTDP-4-dehydrorhamnose 3,5-epimerase [Streptosporangiaceae bacterium]|jgi:dTDP-4-dehydrorhamnose 3,5-epimerase
MDALEIDGAWVFTPRIHDDQRGSFLEWFTQASLRTGAGHPMQVAQVNCSVSARGVIRGIHFTDVPPGQAKYVSCLSGEILDVIVDLRAGSPGFGRWTAVPLDGKARRAVYIAEGLGHGFVTLSDEATVLYLCSSPYAPGREHGVHPLDPGLGIDWGMTADAILSARDAAAPTLEQALRAGLLPGYRDCQDYTAGLRAAAGG